MESWEEANGRLQTRAVCWWHALAKLFLSFIFPCTWTNDTYAPLLQFLNCFDCLLEVWTADASFDGWCRITSNYWSTNCLRLITSLINEYRIISLLTVSKPTEVFCIWSLVPRAPRMYVHTYMRTSLHFTTDSHKLDLTCPKIFLEALAWNSFAWCCKQHTFQVLYIQRDATVYDILHWIHTQIIICYCHHTDWRGMHPESLIQFLQCTALIKWTKSLYHIMCTCIMYAKVDTDV